ncbi:MFS transporter [Izhakiella australiensis]|uniref:MFS transporter n=1 Tax=Izhakiella australiensis TaxID=1926881 RepID=A0A1S8YTC1_9GAMM|nr:MFS transporter [Izhakiella australiensis]OON41997.1 MFS transporter [Izhakiella australiensis]
MTKSSHSAVSKTLAISAIILLGANLRAPITSVGPLLDQIIQTFHLSAVSAGWLNALPLLAFGLLAPVAPIIGRRFGLERALFIAVVLVALGTLVRSIGQQWGLWLGTLLMPSGIALANVLLPPLARRDFSHNPAGIIGLYVTVMSVTASLASGIANPLAELSGSWQFALGIWVLPAMLAVALWGRRIKGLPRSEPVSPPQSVAKHLPDAAASKLRSPWRSALGWQVSLFMALQSLSFYTLLGWFTPYAISQGYSANEAGGLLFCYQIVAIFVNLLGVSLLKKSTDQRLLAFCATLAIFIGIAGLLLMPHLALLWMLITGLGNGSSLLISLSLFGLRTHDHHQAAMLSGMAQCVGYITASVGPLAFGVIHTLYHAWQPALVVLLLSVVLQMLFAALAGRNQKI